MKQEKKQSSKVTIGLDLGDRRHRVCVLDRRGEVIEEATVGNDRVSLGELSQRYRGALAVLEAGCHSPWISRYLQEQRCVVLVANPRKLPWAWLGTLPLGEIAALTLAAIAKRRKRSALPSAT